MRQTAASIYEYFEVVIGERTAHPGDDLVTKLLQFEVDGDRLTHDDVLDTCFLFLAAGLDTVSASLDCLMLHLATHPDQRRALVENPDLIPNAVEELLRWESPVMTVARVTTEDTEIGGCPVGKGQQVLVMLGAANADPDSLEDADVVRFDRDVNRHIAFGKGIHRCLGSHLARLELRIALPRVTRASPTTGCLPASSRSSTPRSGRSRACPPARVLHLKGTPPCRWTT